MPAGSRTSSHNSILDRGPGAVPYRYGVRTRTFTWSVDSVERPLAGSAHLTLVLHRWESTRQPCVRCAGSRGWWSRNHPLASVRSPSSFALFTIAGQTPPGSWATITDAAHAVGGPTAR